MSPGYNSRLPTILSNKTLHWRKIIYSAMKEFFGDLCDYQVQTIFINIIEVEINSEGERSHILRYTVLSETKTILLLMFNTDKLLWTKLWINLLCLFVCLFVFSLECQILRHFLLKLIVSYIVNTVSCQNGPHIQFDKQ